MSKVFIIILTVLTQSHDFAVCYKAGPQLWMVVLLQPHQYADDLS